MSVEQVVPGIYRVNLSIVNAYLLDDGGDLTLIDTGTSGSADKILSAVYSLGRSPASVTHILVTHLHADHTGSLAALKALTGAPAFMHPADAEMVRSGKSVRPSDPAPGLMNWLIVKVFMALRGTSGIELAEIEHEVNDGDRLDLAGGLQVIHAPGHAAGQVCFLREEHGGVLFAADAASNMLGLGYPPIFEDQQQGLASLRKLSTFEFEAACFGHGAPLARAASNEFVQKWGN
jgi:glyoxylase-like metal-dependent hydrolase (beta-lactamase superfamily II)